MKIVQGKRKGRGRANRGKIREGREGVEGGEGGEGEEVKNREEMDQVDYPATNEEETKEFARKLKEEQDNSTKNYMLK